MFSVLCFQFILTQPLSPPPSTFAERGHPCKSCTPLTFSPLPGSTLDLNYSYASSHCLFFALDGSTKWCHCCSDASLVNIWLLASLLFPRNLTEINRFIQRAYKLKHFSIEQRCLSKGSVVILCYERRYQLHRLQPGEITEMQGPELSPQCKSVLLFEISIILFLFYFIFFRL